MNHGALCSNRTQENKLFQTTNNKTHGGGGWEGEERARKKDTEGSHKDCNI